MVIIDDYCNDCDKKTPPHQGTVTTLTPCRELHQQLVSFCNGDAATIVKSNRTGKNGFETWRRLYEHYAVKDSIKGRKLLFKVMSTRFSTDYTTVLLEFTQLQALISEYHTASGRMPDDKLKITHMSQYAPTALVEHLSLNPSISTWSEVCGLIVNFTKMKMDTVDNKYYCQQCYCSRLE